MAPITAASMWAEPQEITLSLQAIYTVLAIVDVRALQHEIEMT
jgi:hypothetical protein